MHFIFPFYFKILSIINDLYTFYTFTCLKNWNIVIEFKFLTINTQFENCYFLLKKILFFFTISIGYLEHKYSSIVFFFQN